MKLSAAVSLLSALAIATATDVPRLTADNYAELTDGKSVFLKFFVPKCDHCNRIKPDWQKLSDEWGGSDIGLVAEIDCTAPGGRILCEANDIDGVPALKYGDPLNLEGYQGGRDYDSLAEFAKENLKPLCSPSNMDLCDDKTKAQIQGILAIPDEELDAKISDYEKQLRDADEHFHSEIEKLQASFRLLSEEKDTKQAAVKDAGFGLLKSVKIAKSKNATTRDEL